MNAMFVDYIIFMKLPWQVGLIMCGLAGLIFFLFSLGSIRRELIDNIPTPLKIAVTSAVGAILVDVALNAKPPKA